MSTAQKTNIGIYFEAALPSTDPKDVEAGSKELAGRIIAYAAALVKEPKIINKDSHVTTSTDRILTTRSQPAHNPPTPSKPSATPAPAKTKSKPQAAPLKDFDEGPPHIEVLNWEQIKLEKEAELAAEQAASRAPKAAATAPPDVDENVEWLARAVELMERKSEKAELILTTLLNHGGPMTTAQLLDKSKLDPQSLANWLSTDKKKKQFVKSTGRGMYEINRPSVD